MSSVLLIFNIAIASLEPVLANGFFPVLMSVCEESLYLKDTATVTSMICRGGFDSVLNRKLGRLI